jgi:hypothetical protein
MGSHEGKSRRSTFIKRPNKDRQKHEAELKALEAVVGLVQFRMKIKEEVLEIVRTW